MQPTLQSILYIFRDPATSAIITLIGTLVGIPFTIWSTMRTTKTNEPPIHTHIRIMQQSHRPRRRRKNNKKRRPTVRNNRVTKSARQQASFTDRLTTRNNLQICCQVMRVRSDVWGIRTKKWVQLEKCLPDERSISSSRDRTCLDVGHF